MNIQENVSLGTFTTFRIGGKARFFTEVNSVNELKEAVIWAKAKTLPFFILGGGSNLLISDSGFPGLVIKMNMKGIDLKEMDSGFLVLSGAGEVWDDLVSFSVSKNLSGIENLSAIPGSVGAAPVQNIGAYGVELKDVFYSVEVFDSNKVEILNLNKEDCQFGYRDSLFKKPEGKGLIITKVILKLSKGNSPKIDYKDLKEYFSAKNNLNPSVLEVRNAVCEIRKNKLPDWHTLGTAGSFFKNPIISKEHFEKLLKEYPGIYSYPVDHGNVKVPLAWILDNVCHLKGFKMGKVGLYERQPLALVNFGGATESDIKKLSEYVSKIVKEKTGIEIEMEVIKV